MKIWEAMKELTEHKIKVFRSGKRTISLDVDGNFVHRVDGVRCLFSYQHIDDEWTELKQPVTWQEAIQAWEKGNKVTVEIDSIGGVVKQGKVPFSETISLSRAEITDGTWYVED